MKIKTIGFLSGLIISVSAVLTVTGCDLFSDGNISQPSSSSSESGGRQSLSSLRLSQSGCAMKAGEMQYIAYHTTPSYYPITPTWYYDTNILSVSPQGDGVIVKGLREGQSALTLQAENRSATCMFNIQGYADGYVEERDPYIYSDTSIVQMQPGQTQQFRVSLYQGDASDIDGYQWTVDNPAIISINTTGQYCTVDAKQAGYARITVRHKKAQYPYYIGVYVLTDLTTSTYLTTTQNILHMNKADGTRSVTVKLVNPIKENWKNGVEWKVVKGSEYIQLLSSGDQGVITPMKAGEAEIQVTHPDSPYPLEIVCQVIEIIQNVYVDVNPASATVILTGSTEQVVTASLAGLKENAEYSVDDFTYEFEPGQEICSYSVFGNKITLKGNKNGSTSLYIGHPKAERKRQVLIIAEKQSADAVDSSCYITTTQDYIRTKVGDEDTVLNVMLKGGLESDSNNFKFMVKSSPKNGTGDVIQLRTASGAAGSLTTAAAAQTYCYGEAVITPVQEGEAVIVVTHPKSYYPLEILVKVLNANAVLSSPLYLTGEGIVTLLNGQTKDYSVLLSGEGKTASDDASIRWQADSQNKIEIIATGSQAKIKSRATGNNVSHINVSHPKVEYDKDVVVLTADTEEQLKSMKVFYATKTYYSVNKGQTVNCYVQSYGFEDGCPFTGISWMSNAPSIASVEFDPNDPLKGIIKGNGTGSAIITCRYYDVSMTFNVTVYSEGHTIPAAEEVCYISTTQNVINIPEIKLSKTLNITASGIKGSDVQNITWSIDDPSVASLAANGLNGTVTSLKEGETVIKVSHPKSANTLKIYVRIGSEYVDPSEKIVYINCNTDVIAITKDSPQFELKTVLVNAPAETSQSGFRFSVDDSSVATVTGYADGKCYVRPRTAGQAEITVSHPSASYDKKVLVVIGNTQEELAAFRYLTTTTNVIAIPKGSTRTVSCTMMNSEDQVVSGYSWESEDPRVCSVSSSSANNAVITANSVGTVKVTVRNDTCSYPLSIIVQVVDASVAASANYIQVNNPVLTLLTSQSYTSVQAELVGGDAASQQFLEWSSSDPSIVDAYGQNGVGKIRAKNPGICYVIVRHKDAIYEQRILCICEESSSSDYSISLDCPNIISIKPDGGDYTVGASLTNGTNADRNNFKWSLDVYDVVDLVYSGNTATITPKKEGVCRITASHPKSPYDQTVVVKVQSFDTFGFSSTNKTVLEGQSTFISMEVPATTGKSFVRYKADNPVLVSVTGTAAMCQITGLNYGTTVVRAELVDKLTDDILASAEILVAIEKAATDAIYISSAMNFYSIPAGAMQTVGAILSGTGVTNEDQMQLKWKSSNPDICSIFGATGGWKVGKNVTLVGNKPGECVVTVSHEKTKVTYDINILVPGRDELTITLDKTYCVIERMQTSQLVAKIPGGTSEDYKSITWTASRVDGEEIVRVTGLAQNVQIQALKAGECIVTSTLPNGQRAQCQILVEDAKNIAFDTQSIRIQPGQSKEIGYTVSPKNVGIRWMLNNDSYFTYTDLGNTDGKGKVRITGVEESSNSAIQLTAITDYSNKASLNVIVAWDYAFTLNRTSITGSPDETYSLTYKVHPESAKVEVTSYNECDFAEANIFANNDGTGTIIINPVKEGTGTIKIGAINKAIGNTPFKEIDVHLDFTYGNLNLVPASYDETGKFISSNGNFSFYDDTAGIIYIGDGENVNYLIRPDRNQAEKADYDISTVDFNPADKNAPVITANAVSGASDMTIYSLSGGEDRIDSVYRFTNMLTSMKYPNGGDIDFDSFKGLSWVNINAASIPSGSGSYTSGRTYVSDVQVSHGTSSVTVKYKQYKETNTYAWSCDGGSALIAYQNAGWTVSRSSGSYGSAVPAASLAGYSTDVSPVEYFNGSGHEYAHVLPSPTSWNNDNRPSCGIYYFRLTKGADTMLFYGSGCRIERIYTMYDDISSSPEYYTPQEVAASGLLSANPYKLLVESPFKDVVATEFAGNLKITFTHIGKRESKTIPVYKVTRACRCTQE